MVQATNRLAAVLAAALLTSSGAQAAPIISISVTDTSGPDGVTLDSADGFQGADSFLSGNTAAAGGVGTTGSTQLQFGADTDSCRLSTCIGGITGTSSPQALDYTAEVTITFTPSISAGANWAVELDGALIGNTQVLGDGGGGSGTASKGLVEWDGGSRGSFGVTDFIPGPGLSGNTFFNETGGITVTGTGPSVVAVTLGVDFELRSTPGGFAIDNGEDACARFGIDIGNSSSAPAEVLCPEYPGLGLADPATHGLFLDYEITAVPEPGTALLLAAGMAGLAAAGRRKVG